MKGWFNFFDPQLFYFRVRVERFFGNVGKIVRVDGEKLTDAQQNGFYSETVDWFEVRYRHAHLSAKQSFNIHKEVIERDIERMFAGTIRYEVLESDEQAYQDDQDSVIEEMADWGVL